VPWCALDGERALTASGSFTCFARPAVTRCVTDILEDYSKVLVASSFVSCGSKICFIVGLNTDVQAHPWVLIFLILAAAGISRLMLLSHNS